MKTSRTTLIAIGIAALAGGSASAFTTSIAPYARPLTTDHEVTALLSVGDQLPLTRDPSRLYQMVGIPDGLGATRNSDGTITVYVSHELVQGALSRPIVGSPRNRGAIVSAILLDRDGNVVSGDRAYDHVFVEDTLVGPAAAEDNATPGFGRFCSGSLAGAKEGLDRPIYFANEESGAPATFDGRGGLAVAIFDGEAHALPALGRFPWENTLIQSFGNLTVAMGMEDGPTSQDPGQPNSQLYMYVGTKDRSPGATVLERNGLVGGTLHVFRAKDAAKNSELAFRDGSIAGEWVAIPNAASLSEAQLEAASDAAGAMVFARPEDGAFDPRGNHAYFFVTTGGAAGANVLGRLYALHLNPADPRRPAELTLLYDADAIVAAGGDIALSPDNIGVDGHSLMIQEDGTAQSRPVMASRGRDGSIWRIDLTGGPGGIDLSSAERVIELDPPGRDGVAVGPGVWETSGIIPTTGLLGEGSWLFDVQAHGPTTAPAPDTIEDGQLLLMRRVRGESE